MWKRFRTHRRSRVPNGKEMERELVHKIRNGKTDLDWYTVVDTFGTIIWIWLAHTKFRYTVFSNPLDPRRRSGSPKVQAMDAIRKLAKYVNNGKLLEDNIVTALMRRRRKEPALNITPGISREYTTLYHQAGQFATKQARHRSVQKTIGLDRIRASITASGAQKERDCFVVILFSSLTGCLQDDWRSAITDRKYNPQAKCVIDHL
ncbi:hypothetical protein C8J56DRAFT_295906 [Mycena floridula]|nr:hypothetical protein C8J56DRAFT_295906 [Mycena floridula]